MARFYPAATVSSLNRDLDNLFDTFFTPNRASNATKTANGHFPAMRFFEEDNFYAAEIVAPGVEPDAFNINVTGNELTISNVDEKAETKSENKTNWYSYQFSRSVELPGDADAGKIEAEYKHGILTLRIPKKEEAKPRKIDVKIH